MKVGELPQAVQNKLAAAHEQLPNHRVNTAYTIELYNATGTRYFIAQRRCRCWNDSNGNYMPFGGGTYWTVSYGKVQVRAYKSCMGTTEYELFNGKRFTQSANGTVIPDEVATKKQVIELIKKLDFTL